MTDTELSKVLDKIQKLRALSASENEHEAALAASKMAELMLRYDLEMADLEGYTPEESDPFDQIYFEPQRGVGGINWRRRLVSIAAYGAGCKTVVFTTKYGDPRGKWSIVGRRHNLEMFRELYAWLQEELLRVADTQCHQREETWVHATAWKQSFLIGAVQGVYEQLYEMRKSVEAENSHGLIVLTQELEEAYAKMHPHTKNVRNEQSRVNGAAYHSGLGAGKTASLTRSQKVEESQHARIS
jgi:hypothetical protein